MSFGLLRVFNDDIIAPGKGFGMHQHDNMEVVSIVLKGSLEHKDSMGNHGIIKAGEVQRMSAGSGIFHSEFNPSDKENGHFLQIWIEPKKRGIKPSYEQKNFSDLEKNKLHTIVSGDKNKNVLYIHQDAVFLMGNFDKNKTIEYNLKNSNHIAYVFVLEGEIEIDKNKIKTGDSAEITGANTIQIKTNEKSNILVIEVPLG